MNAGTLVMSIYMMKPLELCRSSKLVTPTGKLLEAELAFPADMLPLDPYAAQGADSGKFLFSAVCDSPKRHVFAAWVGRGMRHNLNHRLV